VQRLLTTLLPTRDRPAECVRQLRFLHRNGVRHRIIVLDASEAAAAEAVRAACEGVAEYRHFDRSFRMADKLAAGVKDVATPFVHLVPDDDLILPHAIAAALAFLDAHPDFIAAHGYFLGVAMHDADIDLHSVIGFAPSIDDDNPLRRHYDLFRRYQSFYWGIFRTPVFASAVTAACAMQVVLFRELTVMSTSILQGKVARLPIVYALHGTARSHAATHQSHPLYWTLSDAQSFFASYLVFRDAIVAFMRSRGIAPPSGGTPEQFLDMSHATWLGREVDVGTFNHAARLLLGDPLPPLVPDPSWRGWREPSAGDVVHVSSSLARRYVWRRETLEAEPRAEIAIDPDEMARVEQELDAYR
jgi:glycosyltransferase domain-containing protein